MLSNDLSVTAIGVGTILPISLPLLKKRSMHLALLPALARAALDLGAHGETQSLALLLLQLRRHGTFFLGC